MERCSARRRGDCPLSKAACGIISHHIFFPRGAYAPGVETDFRELQTNRVPMCKIEEIELHQANPEGPPKPSIEVMEHCVETERLRRELAARPINKP